MFHASTARLVAPASSWYPRASSSRAQSIARPAVRFLANDVARARRRSAMLAKRDLFALLLSAFAVYYGTRLRVS